MTTMSLTAGVPPRDRLEHVGLLALVGHCRRHAAVHCRLPDPAGPGGRHLAHLARAARRARRGAGLLLAAGGLRGAHAAVGRLLAGSARELHRLQAAGAAAAGAAGVRPGARRARQFAAEHHPDHRRGQRARGHRPVRRAQLRQPGPPAAGHAVALDDLLGHADAGRSAPPWRACCTARAGRLWAAFIMPALLVALILTLTRGAWVGVAVGVGVLLLRKDFRLLALLPIVVAAMVAARAGGAHRSRLLDVRPATTRPTATASPCCRPASASCGTIR